MDPGSLKNFAPGITRIAEYLENYVKNCLKLFWTHSFVVDASDVSFSPSQLADWILDWTLGCEDDRNVSDRTCQTSCQVPSRSNESVTRSRALGPQVSHRDWQSCDPVQLNQQSFELPGFFLSKMSFLGQVILMSWAFQMTLVPCFNNLQWNLFQPQSCSGQHGIPWCVLTFHLRREPSKKILTPEPVDIPGIPATSLGFGVPCHHVQLLKLAFWAFYHNQY